VMVSSEKMRLGLVKYGFSNSDRGVSSPKAFISMTILKVDISTGT
jgi:hypothetical protein